MLSDLDSLSSSLLYAYIRSQSPPKQAFTPLYIPLVHIRAADLSIRPEFLALLPYANLDPSHVITLDDLPQDLATSLPSDNTRWILVDHNVLQGELGAVYSNRVTGVIDHHDDEGKVPADTGDEPRIIEKTASCSTLVTEYVKEAWDKLSSQSGSSKNDNNDGIKDEDNDGADPRVWDAQAATLAMASILIDSSALQDQNKTTPHDKKAVAYLEAKIKADPQAGASWDRKAFYEKIDAAKRDLDSLSLDEVLRKDYKEWKAGDMKLGVSSVVKPLPFLIDKAVSESGSDGKDDKKAFDKALKAFAKERKLGLFSIMTTSQTKQGKFQRELLLWGLTDKATEAAKRFEEQSSKELGLQKWDGNADIPEASEGWRKVWWQKEVQHSRKRVAPLLREAMS